MGIERHRWASRQAEVSGTERVNTYIILHSVGMERMG
jgi:hypothetical protein